MKIMLSRKGFDSGNGGVPSPILEDRTLVSLPIPSDDDISYEEIHAGDCQPGKLVSDLTSARTNSKIQATSTAHLDPDLNRASVSREANWRPLFGQCNAALSHLQNNNVGKGDLFLFFGWFRRAKRDGAGEYGFVRKAPNLHVLFGWLQVDQVWNCAEDEIPSWAQRHPHVARKYGSVFVASEYLNNAGIAGGGTFKKFGDSLCLTALGKSRSVWRLPKWFYPFNSGAKRTPLSYHGQKERWKVNDDFVELNTAKIGQEFILNADEYPEAVDWAQKLISQNQ
jgi:hypothetical protein